ncbi:ATPase [Metapseudomonas resinovorans]|uniref:ATP-binding protein n=1 Tax=Metapseudomonas resinovorans TaxID=53412 RepID=UPI0009854D1A|nr:ATP-binding protein [Pseudomonas resinovorans]GLZ86696.1 ATPase [Pseudomonas resinovorans]
MDALRNPYTPYAGAKPPEIVGLDGLRSGVRVALERLRMGKPAKGVIAVGLRGMGKTTLLNQLQDDAELSKVFTVYVESRESTHLPALLIPGLQAFLLKLERIASAKECASRGLRGLAGFVKTLDGPSGGIAFIGDYQPEPGLADNGNLEADLTDLLVQVGTAASLGEVPLVMLIDDLHRFDDHQLGALIAAMHRTAQRVLPIVLIGAGYPSLRGKAGNLKPYAERLFEFPVLGPLEPQLARTAFLKPAHDNGVIVDESVVDLVLDLTKGYPFFIQQWGKSIWDAATGNHFTAEVVRIATPRAIAELDQRFFTADMAQTSLAEKHYLRAMATLGTPPHHAREIARVLGMSCEAAKPLRRSLICQGVLWGPNDDETSFTAPMFDQFIYRTK